MRCLFCGKPILDDASLEEKESRWHRKCIKKFFNTKEMPQIDISEDTIKQLAIKTVNKGYTIPGVQKKLSLHLSFGDNPRLTLVDYPSGFILKPQVEEYKQLPESEFLVMQMAEITGIKTVPHALLYTNNSYAYITKRIDREVNNNHVKKYAMEDFCQLDGRLTQDKYKGSYEKCSKIIKAFSSQSGLDIVEFYLRLVFSFVVGNSDMHLKNFSLIEKEYKSGQYVLSSAYDLLPVNIILIDDNEEFALSMCSKKSNINYSTFIRFAEYCEISLKVANNLISKVVGLEEKYIEMCEDSLLTQEMKESFKDLIHNRINRLVNY